jgi:uncharacterized membrane protein YgcG
MSKRKSEAAAPAADADAAVLAAGETDDERATRIEARLAATPMTNFVWPRRFDSATFMKHLEPSLACGQLTNHGPACKRLEVEIVERCGLTQHVAVACASGTAALHALYATYEMLGYDLSKGQSRTATRSSSSSSSGSSSSSSGGGGGGGGGGRSSSSSSTTARARSHTHTLPTRPRAYAYAWIMRGV